jgi:hypothetical protein
VKLHRAADKHSHLTVRIVNRLERIVQLLAQQIGKFHDQRAMAFGEKPLDGIDQLLDPGGPGGGLIVTDKLADPCRRLDLSFQFFCQRR